MDPSALLQSIRACEALTLEKKDYRGLTLEMLYRSWPEEVTSGRCVNRKCCNVEDRAVKAYVKFVQAAKALEDCAKELSPSAPRRRFASLPTTEALVPLGASYSPSTQPALMDVTTTEDSDLPSSGSKASLANAFRAFRPRSVSAAQQDIAGLVQQCITNQLQRAGIQMQPQQSPRSRVWILVLLLLSLLMPHFIARLVSLAVELCLLVSRRLAARVYNAGATEATRAGVTLVNFVEDVLDVCINDPETSHPSDAPTSVAARIAATSVATTLAGQHGHADLSPQDFAAAVEAAVQTAASQSTSTSVAQDKWTLPAWVLVLIGMVVPGIRTHVGQQAA